MIALEAPPGSHIDSACPTLGKSSYLKTLTRGSSRLSLGHEQVIVEECPDDEDFEEEAIDDYTLSDEELEGGTPHVNSDGVFISSGVVVKNDDAVAAAQVPLPNSGISKLVEPIVGKWRDLFFSNRSITNCPTLVHFSDSNNAENCTLLDGDLDSNSDVWKLCVMVYVEISWVQSPV